MTPTDWIFTSLSILLALGAMGVTIVGLWGDRLRGRTRTPRCPKCWYDLSAASGGTTPPLCTECGRLIAHERELHRTRRRWWTLVPAIALLGASVFAWVWPTIDRQSWHAAVPTWAIVRFWPIDEVAWMEGNSGNSYGMIDELSARLDWGEISDADARAWARRVESAFAREARGAKSGTGETRLLCIDQAQLGFLPQDDLEEARERAAFIITQVVAPEGWEAWGGLDGATRWCGSTLLVMNKPPTLRRVEVLVAAITRGVEQTKERPHSESGGTQTPHSENGDTQGGSSARVREVAIDGVEGRTIIRDVRDVIGVAGASGEALAAEVWTLRTRLIAHIEPDSWVENGGAAGEAWVHRGLLIIRQTPEVQARIDDFLARLRRGEWPEIDGE